ncbi:tRNA dimethylallyltransferase [Drosophila guanche]|uniref:Blast:tRNA dimethylallyltransferase, mitochondrial n=1 Tax=Drosophila guanche TaxID=7266 RepID=A0A3B0JD58_DROGU|nr:tRNA dimethylallyltransferase [Drosophila guanche]SPP80327.1 blast:tRNA dimethylallyltransferase%2C mitochondrial [Drosophila guanche]
MMRKVPLIVILGSTGTGKTKLSLELAERFGGEIISADSMQVYTNLDIATAKATKEEQARARHHLLDVATPAEPFTVTHFRNAALPIIERLLTKSTPPIVVGGTNYYIESLLWDILVDTQEGDSKNSSLLTQQLADETLAAMTTAALHQHLASIDAGSANRIHPNNRRKILRAIEVYQGTGQTLTEKLAEQRQRPGGNRLGGPLRYPHTILLWLRCQQDVLNARLDGRVDGMLQQGLLKELRQFHDENKAVTVQAYTSGVLQTIGYKEFVPYLMKHNEQQDEQIEEYLRTHAYRLPSKEELKQEGLPVGIDLLRACCDELKLVTRRYSKKQIKWINNRFLGSKDRQVPDLYELDTSDVSAWPAAVYQRAEFIVESYRSGQLCEIEPMAKRVHPGADLNEETSNFCAICERHFVGEYQWGLHLKSNKHKRRREAKRRKEREQEQEAERQQSTADKVFVNETKPETLA